MLSIRAEFLTGRYVAADPYRHDEPEWPPHPGRLFAAMAAAYFEGGKDGGERGALEWIERCGPPSISYDRRATFPRETVSHFVPVNDRSECVTPGQTPLGTTELRCGRLRKERLFPTTITGSAPVTFAWDGVDARAHMGSFRAICSRVHRLGHSSSIVHLTAGEDAQGAVASLIPSERGGQKIRWVSPGTLARFEAAYDAGDVKNGQERPYFVRKARLNAVTLLPALYSSPQGGSGRVPSGQFAEMHVLEITKRPYPTLAHARAISRAVKARLLANASDAKELVLGIDAGGRPTTGPHISVVPLAFVRHRHADGMVRGVAIVVPRGLDQRSVNAVLRSLHGKNRTGSRSGDGGGHGGSPHSLSLEVHGHGMMVLTTNAGDPTSTLDPSTWARQSKTWSSVTPIVLDRAPRARGDAYDAEVSRTIARSCTLQGLPAPASVYTSNVPYLSGPPLSTAFPRYTLPTRGSSPAQGAGDKKPAKEVARVHTHARITFDEDVCGPVILGAGRYNGYGLCMPTRGGGR